jgi:transcriptional regulator with XRE-family HTH domain
MGIADFDFDDGVARKLERIRELLSVTQIEMAHKLGLTPISYRNMPYSDSDIALETVQKLSRLFGRHWNYLISGSGYEFPELNGDVDKELWVSTYSAVDEACCEAKKETKQKVDHATKARVILSLYRDRLNEKTIADYLRDST